MFTSLEVYFVSVKYFFCSFILFHLLFVCYFLSSPVFLIHTSPLSSPLSPSPLQCLLCQCGVKECLHPPSPVLARALSRCGVTLTDGERTKGDPERALTTLLGENAKSALAEINEKKLAVKAADMVIEHLGLLNGIHYWPFSQKKILFLTLFFSPFIHSFIYYQSTLSFCLIIIFNQSLNQSINQSIIHSLTHSPTHPPPQPPAGGCWAGGCGGGCGCAVPRRGPSTSSPGAGRGGRRCTPHSTTASHRWGRGSSEDGSWCRWRTSTK